MSFEEFKASLNEGQPPKEINQLLKALWHDAKGDWEVSHSIAQDIPSNEGSWVHAYLHRKEGDNGNASYWYIRAGRTMPKVSLDEEWVEITKALLKK